MPKPPQSTNQVLVHILYLSFDCIGWISTEHYMDPVQPVQEQEPTPQV